MPVMIAAAETMRPAAQPETMYPSSAWVISEMTRPAAFCSSLRSTKSLAAVRIALRVVSGMRVPPMMV